MVTKQETRVKARAWAGGFPVGTQVTYWPWGEVEIVECQWRDGWPCLHCKLVMPSFGYEHLKDQIIYVLYSYRHNLKVR